MAGFEPGQLGRSNPSSSALGNVRYYAADMGPFFSSPRGYPHKEQGAVVGQLTQRPRVAAVGVHTCSKERTKRRKG